MLETRTPINATTEDIGVVTRRDAAWERHEAKWEDLVREHPLRYLFMEVTRRCNLKCLYCGSDCTSASESQELSSEQWISIAQQIAEDYDPPRLMIAVTGGEPLLKPGIFDLFNELTRLGFPYGMVTNGTLLTEAKARALVAAGIGSISLSLDAPPEVNDTFRGKGAAAAVTAAVGQLRAAGFDGKLEIISSLTRAAIGHLEATRQFIAQLRVPSWRVAPIMPIGRAAQQPDLVPGPAEIRTLLEYVRAAREDQLLPRPEFCEEGFVGNRFEGVVRPFLAQCRAGITTGGIRANGRIGACPELSDAFLQGDILTERFKEVWDTRFQVLRDRSWTKTGACTSCHAYARCKGGAMHLYPAPSQPPLRCLYLQAKEDELSTAPQRATAPVSGVTNP